MLDKANICSNLNAFTLYSLPNSKRRYFEEKTITITAGIKRRNVKYIDFLTLFFKLFLDMFPWASSDFEIEEGSGYKILLTERIGSIMMSSNYLYTSLSYPNFSDNIIVTNSFNMTVCYDANYIISQIIFTVSVTIFLIAAYLFNASR